MKSAPDAAAIAAILELQELSSTVSDEDAATRLQPIADRYVRLNLAANLPTGKRDEILGTLEVSVTVDRGLGSIDVSAEADLGGTLLAKWFIS